MRWISPVISPSDLTVTREKVGVCRISIWITGTVGNATLSCSCAARRRLNSNWSGWRARQAWCSDRLGWCRRCRRAIAVNIEPIWTSASLSMCTLTISRISMAFLISLEGSDNKKFGSWTNFRLWASVPEGPNQYESELTKACCIQHFHLGLNLHRWRFRHHTLIILRIKIVLSIFFVTLKTRTYNTRRRTRCLQLWNQLADRLTGTKRLS